MNLALEVGDGGEEGHHPGSLQVRGGEVMVELAQVIHGEAQAEEVDQDPEEIKDIVPVRTLK